MASFLKQKIQTIFIVVENVIIKIDIHLKEKNIGIGREELVFRMIIEIPPSINNGEWQSIKKIIIVV